LAQVRKKEGSLICLKGGNLDREVGEAVTARERHSGFPATVDLRPIGDISPLFTEKQIVIARW
jgi:16S rRNA (guanine527-N7)-methyltransferase